MAYQTKKTLWEPSKKDRFEHPEGKIKLLNGTVLDCYPIEQQQDKVENDLKLETTDSYLVVGERRGKFFQGSSFN